MRRSGHRTGSRARGVAGLAAAALAFVGLGTAVAPSAATGAVVPTAAAVRAAGQLSVGAARRVDFAAVAAMPARAARTSTRTTLRRDGTPSALWKGATNAPTLAKPSAPALLTLRPPRHVHRSWNGLSLTNSNCGCQPPDVNLAAGNGQLVEAVNLSIGIYADAAQPTLVSNTSLATFLGTSDGLSDPRITWDPTWQRWALSLTDVSTPSLWLAYSTTSDATGGWWIYHVGFPFAAGSIVDFPMVGQTQDAFTYTSNNFDPSSNYINSTVFSVAKARVYNGLGWGAGLGGVAFNTAPVTASGIPLSNSSSVAYFVAPDDADNELILYGMTDPGLGDAKLTLKATPVYSWAAPPRRVNQPGTSQTLDPLDGRFVWSPMLVNGRIYFAHGAAVGSFPGVNYGYVKTNGTGLTVNTAFHSATSDDFNPSIGVYPNPSGTSEYVYLNWSSTDTPNNVPTSMVYSGLKPHDGVQHVGGTVLRTGSITNEFRFGDYSSVSITPYEIVPGCPAGESAFIANEIFTPTGAWTTRLANIGFC